MWALAREKATPLEWQWMKAFSGFSLSYFSRTCAKLKAGRGIAVPTCSTLRIPRKCSMADSTVIFRTYKYRLYPSKAQMRNLYRVLDLCRHLYNMALAERRYTWEFEKRRVSKAELETLAKHYRAKMPYGQQMGSQTAQSVVHQAHLAFQGFFRRVKAGKTLGYPRFKGRTRFNSFLFKQYGTGASIDGRKLKLFGIGRVSVRWHRPIAGKIKTVRIFHKAGKWFALFACEVAPMKPLPATGRAVGIDVGISALITTSDGDKVDNPNFYRTGQKRLRVLQRKLARTKRGSNNRRKALKAVQRQHEHVANQRRDFLHKLSFDLMQSFDHIALEDLGVRNMVRNKHLSKSILDSGWSIFKELLTYKAGSAGRDIVFVDPRYTSMCCSNCDKLFEDFDLSVRWVTCACGLSMDRDHNAAIYILKRSYRSTRSRWVTPVGHNVGAVKAVRVQEATQL